MTISVIIGSTRQSRFCEKPAQWILQQLRKRDTIEARLLDLRDFSMPFFDQPLPPAMPGRPPYEHDVVKKWTAQIQASDGFAFITPEYNYGPSAVLKNAIDWVYPEWIRKAAAFVSYGSHGRPRRPAASRDGHRASDGAGLIAPSHFCGNAVGAFPGWGRREGARRVGEASERHDRRSALVDGSCKSGARRLNIAIVEEGRA
jgi:NAD(P)H-dependent FMN reductase